jgi:hypothetical protein
LNAITKASRRVMPTTRPPPIKSATDIKGSVAPRQSSIKPIAYENRWWI